MAFATLLAVLLSPVIAVSVTVWLQNRKDKRATKLWIFTALMATRHSPITDENVRALNMIDVAFHDRPRVRQLWHEYFEMLSNEGLSNSVGFGQRQKKNLELITEMAKAVGYGKAITHLDVDRVYYPVGLGEQSKRGDELANELLRVLKGSTGLRIEEGNSIELHNTGRSPSDPQYPPA